MAIINLKKTLYEYRGYFYWERILIMTTDAVRNINAGDLGATGQSIQPEPTVDPNATVPMGVMQVTPEQFNTIMQPAFQNYYCSNPIIEQNLNDTDSSNDRYEYPGIPGLFVEYSKVDGQVVAEYSMTGDKPAVTQQQNNQNTLFTDPNDAQRYAELCISLVDPTLSRSERRQVERDLKDLLDENLRKVMVTDAGIRHPRYTDKQIKQIKNGIVEDVIANDRCEHRTVFYDYSDYSRACRELENEQEAARARIQAGGQTPEEKERDINILKTNYSCLSEVQQELVNNMPELFYDDHTEEHTAAQARVDAATEAGEDPDPADLAILEQPLQTFSSDKFKFFCRTLTGDDTNLSLAERKKGWNMLAASMLQNGNDELRAALDRINSAERDEDINADDVELVRHYMRGTVFNTWGPERSSLGREERALVKTAGLNADFDYRPLLTVAGIAVTVGLTALTGGLLCTTKVATANTDISVILSGSGISEELLAEAVQIVEDEAGNKIVTLSTEALLNAHIDSVTVDALAEAFAQANVTGCVEHALANYGLGLLGGSVVPRYDGSPDTPQFGVAEETDETVTVKGRVNIEPCHEPCEEEEEEEICEDCPCPETKAFHMPMPRRSTENGKNYIERIEFWEIMNCFRKPDGSKMTWNELKAFIHAYRAENFADLRNPQTGYFAAGQDHEICTQFTFNGMTYTLDKAALDYLLTHPQKRECHDDRATTRTHGVVKKDEPCTPTRR